MAYREGVTLCAHVPFCEREFASKSRRFVCGYPKTETPTQGGEIGKSALTQRDLGLGKGFPAPPVR